MKNKEPKDLGIKIGSKEMSEWKDIIEAQEDTIRKSKINLVIALEVLKIAKEEYYHAEKDFKETK